MISLKLSESVQPATSETKSGTMCMPNLGFSLTFMGLGLEVANAYVLPAPVAVSHESLALISTVDLQ